MKTPGQVRSSVAVTKRYSADVAMGEGARAGARHTYLEV